MSSSIPKRYPGCILVTHFFSWIFMFGNKIRSVEHIGIIEKFVTCVKEVLGMCL